MAAMRDDGGSSAADGAEREFPGARGQQVEGRLGVAVEQDREGDAGRQHDDRAGQPVAAWHERQGGGQQEVILFLDGQGPDVQ